METNMNSGLTLIVEVSLGGEKHGLKATARRRVSFIAVRYHVLDKDKPPMIETMKTLNMLEAKLLGPQVLPLLSPADALALEKTNKHFQKLVQQSSYTHKFLYGVTVLCGISTLTLNPHLHYKIKSIEFRLAYDGKANKAHREFEDRVSLVTTRSWFGRDVRVRELSAAAFDIPHQKLLDYFLRKIFAKIAVEQVSFVNVDSDVLTLVKNILKSFKTSNFTHAGFEYSRFDMLLPDEEKIVDFVRAFPSLRNLILYNLKMRPFHAESSLFKSQLNALSLFLNKTPVMIDRQHLKSLCGRATALRFGVCPELNCTDLRWLITVEVLSDFFAIIEDNRDENTIWGAIVDTTLTWKVDDEEVEEFDSGTCYIVTEKNKISVELVKLGSFLLFRAVDRKVGWKERDQMFPLKYTPTGFTYGKRQAAVMLADDGGRALYVDLQIKGYDSWIFTKIKPPKNVTFGETRYHHVGPADTRRVVFLGVRFHKLDDDSEPFYESFKNLTELPRRILIRRVVAQLPPHSVTQLLAVSKFFKRLVDENTQILQKREVGVAIEWTYTEKILINQRRHHPKKFLLDRIVDDNYYHINCLGIRVSERKERTGSLWVYVVDARETSPTIDEDRLFGHIINKVLTRVAARSVYFCGVNNERLKIFAKMLHKTQRPLPSSDGPLSCALKELAFDMTRGSVPDAGVVYDLVNRLPNIACTTLEVVVYPYGSPDATKFALTKPLLSMFIEHPSRLKNLLLVGDRPGYQTGEDFFNAMTTEDEWQGGGNFFFSTAPDGRRFLADITEDFIDGQVRVWSVVFSTDSEN